MLWLPGKEGLLPADLWGNGVRKWSAFPYITGPHSPSIPRHSPDFLGLSWSQIARHLVSYS